MLSKSVALLLAVVSVCSAENIITDCGPPDAAIKFNHISISPMPFDLFGTLDVEADVTTTANLGSTVRMSINMQKSNLNNGFLWEIPCTNIGFLDASKTFTGYLGTCEYKGACDFPLVKTWVDTQNCPDFFTEYKIPCQCPFPATDLKTKGPVKVDLKALADKMPDWLVEGGYIIKAELRDTALDDKLVGCMEMKFDIKPKKECPPLLQRLNACP